MAENPRQEQAPTQLSVTPIREYGKYLLVRKLAEGGMAEIFLAKQVGAEGFERNVVIKRMLPHLSAVSEFVGMFLDEARLAAQLTHQNIVQINDLGFAEGCYYICMEYLAGEDFSTVLRTAARKEEYVPLEIALQVVIDAARGLHFAHEFSVAPGKALNVVHRDISPANVFVTYSGQVKLLDFGIARAESRVTQTTAGVVKGKYLYMAPEQARGEPVDRRADVFSLGVTLYEALTSARPFARDNDLAILNAVLHSDFPAPAKLRPDLPPELEAVVVRAMAAKLADRYQTAKEFGDALEEFLLGRSSLPGGGKVAAYLGALFGEERVHNRTHIPTLADLSSLGADLRGFSNPKVATIAPGKSPSVEVEITETRAEQSPRAPPGARRSRQRWKAWALALVVASVVAGVGGGLAVGLRGEPKADAPENAGLPLEPPLVREPGAVATAQPPDAGFEQVVDAGSGVVRAIPPTGPVRLSAGAIQKVVASRRAVLMGCFEENRGELEQDKGSVLVQFAILGTGKVSEVVVQGALAQKRVGRCLETRFLQLKFPRHVDKEIRLTLPVEYSLRR